VRSEPGKCQALHAMSFIAIDRLKGVAKGKRRTRLNFNEVKYAITA
jgi:hypothetical protein